MLLLQAYNVQNQPRCDLRQAHENLQCPSVDIIDPKSENRAIDVWIFFILQIHLWFKQHQISLTFIFHCQQHAVILLISSS